jgi:DNA-binding SARP family transcriptional activator
MQICALGPMVVGGREDLQLRDRAVIGVLVARAGTVVAIDELGDAIWGERPPATYRKIVQGSVMRLRREVGEDAIATRQGGYVLRLDADAFDINHLSRLVDEAQSALDLDDPRTAARLAGEALELWRGEPFPELPDWAPAQAERLRLMDLKETAEDLQLEAQLRSGRIANTTARAELLAHATPYREARWALLARAQYAAHRQSDALATLRTLRTRLADDLGIDPAPEIVALEAAVLRHDPSLDQPSSMGSGRWLFSRAGRIVAALLAVTTGLAVGLAIHQHRRAAQEADRASAAQSVATAVRIGELATKQSNPSVALALAAESLRIDDGAQARSLVLDTFGHFSDLLTTGVPPDEPWPPTASVVTAPNGRVAAIAHQATVELVVDGETTHRIATPTELPTGLAFSPDSRFLAAGMSEPGFPVTGATVVWDVETGHEVARFDSGDGAVQSNTFSADASSLWSLGADGIHQWDMTGSHALARTGDGDPVLFRAGDLVLTIRDRSTERWIAYACTLAGRALTPLEWREFFADRRYAPTCR